MKTDKVNYDSIAWKATTECQCDTIHTSLKEGEYSEYMNLKCQRIILWVSWFDDINQNSLPKFIFFALLCSSFNKNDNNYYKE